MLWPRLVLVAAVLGLGPAGCGFHPIYGSGVAAEGEVSADLARVRIDKLRDRTGQQLRNALIDRLSPRGETADPLFSLTINLSETASDLGYRKDSYATLGSLTITAAIALTADGLMLMQDNVSAVVNYDYLGPRYASVVMERDAHDRAVTQLADDIRERVASAIQRYRAKPKDPAFRPVTKGVVPQGAPVRP